MSARRFETPRSVEFDEHRWYTLVTIVDRFGVTQVFRIGDHDGDGVYLTPVNTLTGEALDGSDRW